jgi:heterodisulfide reductase subunit A
MMNGNGAYQKSSEKMPPCQATCPIHQDAQGYVKSIAAGHFDIAAQIIIKDNPLPAICGRVCAHPCTTNCTRGDLDECINLPGLKRFVMDTVSDYSLPVPPIERSEKIAIVGSGPAGLMCAYKLRQEGYKVTIFEALPVAGGMMRVGIPEFRLPHNILEDEIQRIKDIGVEIRLNTKIGEDISLDELRRSYTAVFIGIGAHIDRRLGIDGEELKGVRSGIEFLRKVNLGEKVGLGHRVLVIGGGNSAIDVARTAMRLGSEVTIVYRRTREEMPADHIEIEEAEREGVTIRLLEAPNRVIGKQKVEALECLKMELGEPDESGRPRPVPVEGSEFSIECDEVMLAIGQSPDLVGLGSLMGIETTEWGTFSVNPLTKETNLPGIFAGGDCVTGPDIIVWAMRGGMEAAESIDRYCRGEELEKDRDEEDTFVGEVMVEKTLNQTKDQVKIPHIQLDQRHSFSEVVTGYTVEQAMEEAYRCMNCVLPDSVVEHQDMISSIKESLKAGQTTIEEIAEETGLSKQDTFWHLVAMVKYGEATYEKKSYDCFTYAIKEE